jgi:hypothetical protein
MFPEVKWLYFLPEDNFCVPRFDPKKEHAAVRREWWWEHSNRYVYQERWDPSVPWGPLHVDDGFEHTPTWVFDAVEKLEVGK